MSKIRIVGVQIKRVTKHIYWCEECETATAFYRKGGHPCITCKGDTEVIGMYEDAPVGDEA